MAGNFDSWYGKCLPYNNLVNSASVAKLLALNRQFYQTFALQFSATRLRLQPGVRRILKTLPVKANILDLGCGNGELARELSRRGHQGFYVGLDYSPELLTEAKKIPLAPLRSFFIEVDLASPGWLALLHSNQQETFNLPPDQVFAFAVLHHLPSVELRRRVLSQVRDCMAQGGLFIHSEWQFLSSARWRARVQPWESVGLKADEVEPGDTLLDWRGGGHGLRYVHYFTDEELGCLAEDTGFFVQQTFYSDGEEDRLGLYQIWQSV